MRYFIWLKNLRGGVDPQLWDRDFSEGLAPYYREDCHRMVSEKILQKIELIGADQNISLAEAVAKYPALMVGAA